MDCSCRGRKHGRKEGRTRARNTTTAKAKRSAERRQEKRREEKRELGGERRQGNMGTGFWREHAWSFFHFPFFNRNFVVPATLFK
jgi:hypothetical protein